MGIIDGLGKMSGIGDVIQLAERITPIAERVITIVETVIASSGVKEKYETEGTVSFDFTVEGHRVFVRVENQKTSAIPAVVTTEPEE